MKQGPGRIISQHSHIKITSKNIENVEGQWQFIVFPFSGASTGASNKIDIDGPTIDWNHVVQIRLKSSRNKNDGKKVIFYYYYYIIYYYYIGYIIIIMPERRYGMVG